MPTSESQCLNFTRAKGTRKTGRTVIAIAEDAVVAAVASAVVWAAVEPALRVVVLEDPPRGTADFVVVVDVAKAHRRAAVIAMTAGIAALAGNPIAVRASRLRRWSRASRS